MAVVPVRRAAVLQVAQAVPALLQAAHQAPALLQAQAVVNGATGMERITRSV